jgi:hypothetical protein
VKSDSTADMPALLDNEAGAYKILPGGSAFCSGVVPYQGYEVVRVLLNPWIPLERGYRFIEDYLKSAGRPIQAFCGIELRVPAPLQFSDWSTFNVPYLEQLREWGLLFGEYSGVCRSNIALATYSPANTSLCAFTYIAPTSAKAKTFFLSGQADIDAAGKAIAGGDIGPNAMQKRARYVIDTVGTTLAKLGVSWQETTPAIDSGAPVLILAGIHAGCLELFANSTVQSIRDLKGKTVAATEAEMSASSSLSF